MREIYLAFLALIISWAVFAAQAFRVPPPLAKIVGTADAIVIGRIVSVCDETFKLRVTEVITGGARFNQRSLTIRREPRSPTDPRWAPYEEGQDILAFLIRNGEVGQGIWSFCGIPNDCEWPVDEEFVYLYDRFIDGLQLNSIKLDDHEFFAQILPRSVVISALKGYRSCFRWEAIPSNKWFPRRICGDDVLEAFRGKSTIHRQLVRETLTR